MNRQDSRGEAQPIAVTILLCLAVVSAVGGAVGSALMDGRGDAKVYVLFSGLGFGALFWAASELIYWLYRIAIAVESERDKRR